MSDLMQTGLFENELTFEQEECYIGLPTEVIESIEYDIREARQVVNKASFDLGVILCRVREKYRHNKHGGFEKCVEKRFNFGLTTAYNIMWRYEQFGTFQNFERLDIALSAQTLLSQPATPQEARNEALQRAEQGEKITIKLAKDIIEAQRAQKQAEEESQKAREEVEKAHKQLWQTQEISQRQSERWNAQLDRLRLEIELLKKSPVVSSEAQATIEQLTKQRDNLSRLVNDLSADLDTMRESNEAKRAQEAQDLRVRQNWRSVTDAFHKQVLKLLSQFPTPVDTQVFEAEDWERLFQVRELARRFQAECNELKQQSLGLVVEAG